MLPATLHLRRYNARNLTRAFDVDPVVRAPHNRRVSIDHPFNPSLLIAPRHLHEISFMGISPARKIISEIVGFIIPNDLIGSNTLFRYTERLKTHYMYDNYMKYILYIMHHVGAARVRVALPGGLACQVASMWGWREKQNHFLSFYFLKNGFKIKNKIRKNSLKIPKIVKIISFNI